jgi:Tfp pilus assembly protein PilE
VKLIELLIVILIVSLLASLLAGPTCKAYSRCKKKIVYIQLKHNQDIVQAVNEDFTFLSLPFFTAQKSHLP